MNTCKANGFSNHDMATHRSKKTTSFDEQKYPAVEFGQLDHFLINKQWKNSVKKYHNIHNAVVDTDHSLSYIDFEMKLAVKKKKIQAKHKTYFDPTSDSKEAYNNKISDYMRGLGEENITLDDFVKVIKESAEAELTEKPKEIKKHYISEDTWKLILAKESAVEEGDSVKAQQLANRIKKAAKGDRIKQKLEELEELDDKDGYKWDGLKTMRKQFQPRRTKFRNKDGLIVTEQQFAKEAAEYLHTQQWATPTRNTRTTYEQTYPNHKCKDIDHAKKVFRGSCNGGWKFPKRRARFCPQNCKKGQNTWDRPRYNGIL